MEHKDVMADLVHAIRIDATPAEVYRAITTREGLQSWWTKDVEAEPNVGSLALFGFNHRSTIFRMRINELVRDRRVRWTCEDATTEEWIGTKQQFDLRPNPDGGTDLRFTHLGWRSVTDYTALCNTIWGALLVRLKEYVEGRNPGPFFPD